MKKLITALIIVFLIISCQTDLNLYPDLTIDTEITQDYLLEGDLDLYLNNQQIFRYKGKPGIEVIPIGNESLSDYEDCFVLYIASGSESVGNVSSAIVKIDGIEILNTSDFSNRYKLFTFEICFINPDSFLEVEIRGKPGSYLDIWIEGKIKFPCPEGTFIDERDGQEYKYVCIGDQIWMAENLKATKYNDGTDIPLVTDGSTWGGLSTPAYCWYNNDQSTYGNTYGALYNWYTVETGNLCPTGWHVPSHSEWTTLTLYLGGSAGGKLKESGTTHWTSPNTGATNETGFTALPGGLRNYNGTFFDIGYHGYWWSATEYEANSAWFRAMGYDYSTVCGNDYGYCDYYGKGLGFSVRCVRD